MSMRDYAVDEYGLLLDEKTMKALAKKICEGYTDEDYDEDPYAIMSYDNILDIFSPRKTDSDDKYITADIARFGDDSTVICLWYGLSCEMIKVIPRCGVDEVVSIIKDMCTVYNVNLSHVICDEDGVGGGVVDTLRCKGFVNNSSPVAVRGKQQNFSNLKSQCYFLWADYVLSLIHISEPTRLRRIAVGGVGV